MIVGVPRETFPGERRVALVPAVLPALDKAGLQVVVEAGAGVEAGYPDADYVAKGAKVLPDRAEVFRTADIITQVLCYGSNDRTGKADLPLFHRDQVLVGFLRPLGSVETITEIASKGVISFSVELMPRTTRAQSMDALSSMATINGDMAQTDVALVIGANDVTNPATRTDASSPIFGMPILDVDKARTVMVIKRSMAAGFAGIDNPLYYLDHTLMLFGDAKNFVGNIVRELSGSDHH